MTNLRGSFTRLGHRLPSDRRASATGSPRRLERGAAVRSPKVCHASTRRAARQLQPVRRPEVVPVNGPVPRAPSVPRPELVGTESSWPPDHRIDPCSCCLLAAPMGEGHDRAWVARYRGGVTLIGEIEPGRVHAGCELGTRHIASKNARPAEGVRGRLFRFRGGPRGGNAVAHDGHRCRAKSPGLYWAHGSSALWTSENLTRSCSRRTPMP